MNHPAVRKVKVALSFFEKFAGFEMPSSLVVYLSKYLSIGIQDCPIICEVDFDRTLVIDSSSHILVEELVRFVGSDDIGPMERSLAGRTPAQAFEHREHAARFAGDR